MRHLSFEDFLEAVVRVSGRLPLPTDEEIAAAACADVTGFLMQMSENVRAVFEAERLKCTSMQPPERCVAHVIDLLRTALPSGRDGQRGKKY
eukprot:5978904-Prymnesium_polylepis.2